jgi:hypothetical protein
VFDSEGRAYGQSRIAGSRLNVYALEWRALENLTVGKSIKRNAAG